MYHSNYPNRSLCDVLQDMRSCLKTLQLAPLQGLIEEVQVLGNRMEAAITDKRDYNEYRDELKKLKMQVIEAEEKLKMLNKYKELEL